MSTEPLEPVPVGLEPVLDWAALADAIPEALTVWSLGANELDARLLYANRAAEEYVGDALPAIGELAPAAFREAVELGEWRSALEDGIPRHKKAVRLPPSPSLLFEVHAYPGSAGQVTVVFEKVPPGAGVHAQVFDQVGDAIFYAGLDGKITSANSAAERLSGYERDDLCGRSLFELVAPESVDQVAETMSVVLDGGAPQRIQIRGVRKDGSLLDVELSGNVVQEDGRPVGLVGIARDVSEREALQSQLHRQAFHDSLTGLANRALFLERLTQALARLEHSAGEVAVFLLDLDNFKTINDTHGHAAGDRVLVSLARRLESTVRAGDTVARLGGDEFAFIIEGRNGVLDAARRILSAISSPSERPNGIGPISGSLGIAFAEKGSTAASLLRDADTALYVAKGAGPGQFEVFDKGIRDSLLRREGIVSALTQVIARGEMTVHYQPITSLSNGTMVAVEALARWPSTREAVSPSEFVPLAETNGLITQLGRHVLRRAVADAARWRRDDPGCLPAGIFVNVSAVELTDPEYATTVMDALSAAGLSPSDLTLELTEGTLPDAGDVGFTSTVTALADTGIRFALDDFGTGYSGLASLKRVPLSCIKIDRQFIAAISGRDALAPVTRASLSLGKALGLTVIAEGVETEEQLDYVRGIGCDRAQGFLLGRPQDADSILASITRDSGTSRTRRPRSARPLPSSTESIPAVPVDEQERLEALWSYHVLDSPREAEFDSIVRLAASICETPMGFVSLVDDHREFFKAAIGTDLREAPRDISFCGHAILEPSVFLVPDALEDPRFATNPNVLGGPRVRFYAGSPLVTPSGHTIGELCVKDTKPRNLTAKQQEGLETLARCVIAQLELRKSRAVFPTGAASSHRGRRRAVRQPQPPARDC